MAQLQNQLIGPGYHTDLYIGRLNGILIGVIGCAEGAPFAVMVVEEFFASGYKLLVNIWQRNTRRTFVI
jgi:hypothetical protein